MTNPNPYVGPRTFTYEDRDRYFGRDDEAEALLARVISQRLVLFYSQSGAGKSSLINTHLVPDLREAGFDVLPVGRVGGELPEGVDYVDNIYLFNLLLNLDTSEEIPPEFAHLTLIDFLAGLVSDDGESWTYNPELAQSYQMDDEEQEVGKREESGEYPGAPYVLIIDQFEEIVTTHGNRWPHRAVFFQQLNDAMRRDPNLWVVLTLREDYVASLDPYARHLDDHMRARFYMERMGVQAALQAISLPAEKAGRPFAQGVAETLVDNLRRIRVQGQDAAELGQYLEPVQLQVVCYQLWENLLDDNVRGWQGDKVQEIHPSLEETTDHPVRQSSHRSLTPSPPLPLTGSSPHPQITHADLERSGDVDSSLASFYESAICEVLETEKSWLSERELRNWFDSQLITNANTRGTIHRGEETTSGMRNSVVDALQNRFLLRTELRAGGEWVELVHDRFVEPIQRANRRWLESYANPLVTPTRSWLAAGRDPANLLDGLQLEQARMYVATYPNEPLDVERELLAESERKQATQQVVAAATARRRLILSISGVVIGLILVVLTLWAMGNAREAQTERARAEQERDRAVAAEADTLRNESRRLANLALQQIEIDPVAALNLSLVALPDYTRPITQRRPLVPEAEFALWQTLHSSPERKYVPAYLFDSAQVAIGSQGIVIAEAAPDIGSQLHYYDFDLNSLRLTPITIVADASSGVSWADDGKVLAYDDDNLIVWEAAQQIAARQIPNLSCAEWRPHHSQIAVCTDAGVVLWSPLEDESPENILVDISLLVSDTIDWLDVAWSPSGNWLAAGEKSLLLVDVQNGQSLHQLLTDFAIEGLQFIATSMETSPEAEPATEQLVVWGANGQTRLLSTAGELLKSFDEQCEDDCTVKGVQLSSDGQRLLTYLETGVASLWDFENAEKASALEGHTASILAAAWYGNYVATASVDGTARVWDANRGKEVITLRGHRTDERVLGVHWLEDGRLLTYSQAEGGPNPLPGSLRQWLIFDEDGQPLCRQGNTPPCHALSQALVDPENIADFDSLRWLDDSTIASTRRDGTATHWGVDSGESVTLPGNPEQSTVVWNPTGEFLLTYAPSEMVTQSFGTLWQLGQQEWVKAREITKTGNAVWLPAGLLIDNGNEIALWNELELWDEQIDKPDIILDTVGLVDAVQPTTNVVIVATDDGLLQHWDVSSGSQIGTLMLPAQTSIRHLEASADGSILLAMTALDSSVMVTLWDLQTGQPAWSWPLPSASLNSLSVSLSPDRGYMVVTQNDFLYLVTIEQTPQVVWTNEPGSPSVLAVMWNNDGSRFLTWEYDEIQEKDMARLWRWNTDTHTPNQLLQAEHAGFYAGPLLNGSETRLLTVNAGDTLRVWQIWPDVQGLIAAAKECCVTRRLSELRRKEFVLD